MYALGHRNIPATLESDWCRTSGHWILLMFLLTW
uniref:Uncharacterized protein n=1 Tax=Arundo donax TaxID=35708 RepID=A0A0A9FPZ4_ARUDO